MAPTETDMVRRSCYGILYGSLAPSFLGVVGVDSAAGAWAYTTGAERWTGPYESEQDAVQLLLSLVPGEWRGVIVGSYYGVDENGRLI
jgi:hypothetical protein